jgi:hypothetical protein
VSSGADMSRFLGKISGRFGHKHINIILQKPTLGEIRPTFKPGSCINNHFLTFLELLLIFLDFATFGQVGVFIAPNTQLKQRFLVIWLRLCRSTPNIFKHFINSNPAIKPQHLY